MMTLEWPATLGMLVIERQGHAELPRALACRLGELRHHCVRAGAADQQPGIDPARARIGQLHQQRLHDEVTVAPRGADQEHADEAAALRCCEQPTDE
jgi:hypothetical protein